MVAYLINYLTRFLKSLSPAQLDRLKLNLGLHKNATIDDIAKVLAQKNFTVTELKSVVNGHGKVVKEVDIEDKGKVAEPKPVLKTKEEFQFLPYLNNFFPNMLLQHGSFLDAAFYWRYLFNPEMFLERGPGGRGGGSGPVVGSGVGSGVGPVSERKPQKREVDLIEMQPSTKSIRPTIEPDLIDGYLGGSSSFDSTSSLRSNRRPVSPLGPIKPVLY